MAPPGSRFSTHGALRGPGAVELLDQAIALLRRLPFPVVAIYLLGSLPFWLGVIYFYFDMTQSVNAEARLPGEALGLTLLYFWMKTCQAVFARKILVLLEGPDPEPWTVARWLRTALLQTIVAGSLPVVYPLALLATIPFAWVNAFYHNFSLIATGAASTLDGSFRESAELARLWPKQNHLMLGVLWLGGFVLLLNVALLLFTLPKLLNMFLGIETVFDENLGAWNNSSFYLCLFVFCYLLLNPLNKVIFVLRCFYGRSRTTGADLRAELRHHRPMRSEAGLAAALTLLLIALPASAQNATNSPAPVPSAASTETGTLLHDVQTTKLNRAIDRTLQQDEFAWRMPRAEGTAADEGFFSRMLARLSSELQRFWSWLGKLAEKIARWIFNGKTDPESDSHFSSGAGLPWRAMIIGLAVVALAALLWLALSRWHEGSRPIVEVARTLAPTRTVNLEDENVQADELPEDSWLALARELIESGELRLALRAFYLASLATLARQELVRLAPTKSNRDYLTELTRRLRGESAVGPIFRSSVSLFEGSWYGSHDVTTAVIDSMRSNQQRLRDDAAV
jgi:hypothetical protein